MFTEFKNIDTPALIIEKSIMEKNLRNMQELCNKQNIKLRPHIKTHKTPFLAHEQIRLGACGIASAKVSEAEVMADDGIDDILIANIIIGDLKYKRLVDLSFKVKRLACCVDSQFAALSLNEALSEAKRKIDIYVEINTGLNRSGVNTYPELYDLCKNILKCKSLNLTGLLTHAGHAYSADSIEEVEKIGFLESITLVNYSDKLKKSGIKIKEISVGSTPTAEFCSQVPGITELRVGNYIFHDMIQCSLGASTIDECSLSVLSTVISKPGNRVILDSGSKALSLDKGAHGNASIKGHGYIYNKNATISRLSEEHGIIDDNKDDFYIGEKIRIIPNHACAVMNLYNYAYIVDGENVISRLEIMARGKSI